MKQSPLPSLREIPCRGDCFGLTRSHVLAKTTGNDKAILNGKAKEEIEIATAETEEISQNNGSAAAEWQIFFLLQAH